MGRTMAQLLVGEHAGKEVKDGDMVIAKVDTTFTHDASGPLLIKQFGKLGLKSFANPRKTIIFIDHAVPAPRVESANDQKLLKDFATQMGCKFAEAGTGICHQVMAEEYTIPGELVLGTDSHSCMGGALGAFSTGMGATDVAVAMALGKTWLRVPETWLFDVKGKLPRGVFAKDMILHIIGMLGNDGANYKALEFWGSSVREMPQHERLVLSNMAIEAGAKVGLIPTDERTKEYLAKYGREKDFRELGADSDAEYEKVFEIDASQLKPKVALPPSPDNVKSVDEIGEVKVDEVFIGSCTNARVEDLRLAARILKGRKIPPRVRLVVTPASLKVWKEIVEDGTAQVFLECGAVMTPAGCGACFGALGGVPADGEVILTTTNRNFPGRTGNPKALTYLASPATAAASAITGYISDPRDFL